MLLLPFLHHPRVPELQAAVAGQLLTADQALQVAGLQCLRPFKLPYLPHELLERLVRLADVKTLRAELVGFPFGPGAEGGLLEEQRPGEGRGCEGGVCVHWHFQGAKDCCKGGVLEREGPGVVGRGAAG
jgi:hypothetical protein